MKIEFVVKSVPKEQTPDWLYFGVEGDLFFTIDDYRIAFEDILLVEFAAFAAAWLKEDERKSFAYIASDWESNPMIEFLVCDGGHTLKTSYTGNENVRLFCKNLPYAIVGFLRNFSEKILSQFEINIVDVGDISLIYDPKK